MALWAAPWEESRPGIMSFNGAGGLTGSKKPSLPMQFAKALC
jgi:hypothetical protein